MEKTVLRNQTFTIGGTMKTFYEYTLNNNRICFHCDSLIEVQIGKNKSAYRTRYSFRPENFGQAVMYFNGINIGNGYKKRLLCKTLNKPVLARQK